MDDFESTDYEWHFFVFISCILFERCHLRQYIVIVETSKNNLIVRSSVCIRPFHADFCVFFLEITLKM